MIDFSIIIPARLASTRLPEKLLQRIGDKTILEHSYLAASHSEAKRVVIAADDQKLIDIAESFDAEAVLTKTTHQSGTDRLAECVDLLGLSDNDIVVNLQGDEPFMPTHLVNQCAEILAHDEAASVSTLAARIHHAEDIDNPSAVKVVVNQQGHALYFSRAPIPYNRDNAALDTPQHYLHHLGIYAYRVGFLKRYTQLPQSSIETIEKLEQLRILDNGHKIAVAVVDEKPPKGIDTEADLQSANAYYQNR